MLPDDFNGVNRRRLGGSVWQDCTAPLPGYGKTLLLHAIPASAIRASPEPPRRLMPARLAEERGLGPHPPGASPSLRSAWQHLAALERNWTKNSKGSLYR